MAAWNPARSAGDWQPTEWQEMSFDTSGYLRRATGRAKSDVANKLVSMYLHDVSRRLCNELELSVNS